MHGLDLSARGFGGALAGSSNAHSRALKLPRGAFGEGDVESVLQSYGDVRWMVERGESVFVVYEDVRCAEVAGRELVGLSAEGGFLEAVDPRGRVPSEAVDEGGRVLVRVEVHLGTQELFHMFSTYGDVRSVQQVQGSPQHRIVEFYDLRAADSAMSSLARASDGTSAPPALTVASLSKGNATVLPRRESRSPVKEESLVEEVRAGGLRARLGGCVPGMEVCREGGGREAARGGWCCSPSKIKASDSASSFTVERKSLLAQVRSSSAAWAAEDCAESGESSSKADVFGRRPVTLWTRRGSDPVLGVDSPFLWTDSIPRMSCSTAFQSQVLGGTLPAAAPLQEEQVPFGMEPEQDPNHLLPPDLYDCMNSEKETSVAPLATDFCDEHPQFLDPGLLSVAWPAGHGDCWSPHNGYGLGPSTAQCEAVVPYSGAQMGMVPNNSAYLAPYYHSMNQSAMVQQAIGREVLKRLSTITVNKNAQSGVYPGHGGDQCEEAHMTLHAGRAERNGWGGFEKGARRKGARYGKKAACSDPALESERRTQQERMFTLDLTRIQAGHDKRTTLMIKNIPNKYTQKMLLLTIEEECKGTFDFFYLPIDFKNRCNVGYGFINMIHPDQIPQFVEKFHSKRWEKFNSEKICCIAYARIQGRAALINHFQNSSLMQEDSKHRPLLFSKDGTPDTFPVQMIALDSSVRGALC